MNYNEFLDKYDIYHDEYTEYCYRVSEQGTNMSLFMIEQIADHSRYQQYMNREYNREQDAYKKITMKLIKHFN